MSVQKATLTMAEVIRDPEGAVLALRRAQIAQWHAESRAGQFELILSAFDALRRGDWAPSEYSPQWRARAEAAEAKLAAMVTSPAGDVRELIDHLNGLMDSLDESVSHDQVYEQLQVAWNMARALRPRGTVTDAEVEAAGRVIYERWDEWEEADEMATALRSLVRAALEAAREVHP